MMSKLKVKTSELCNWNVLLTYVIKIVKTIFFWADKTKSGQGRQNSCLNWFLLKYFCWLKYFFPDATWWTRKATARSPAACGPTTPPTSPRPPPWSSTLFVITPTSELSAGRSGCLVSSLAPSHLDGSQIWLVESQPSPPPESLW